MSFIVEVVFSGLSPGVQVVVAHKPFVFDDTLFVLESHPERIKQGRIPVRDV